MPSPEQLKALSDAGGFALFLGFVIAAAIGLWRGWWVPGFIAKRDQERADRAEAENRTLSITVATLTSELKQSREKSGVSAYLEIPMGLRDRFADWLEDVLPYLDRAAARRREQRFAKQMARSRFVQTEASLVINEVRKARREHMRGSYKRADDRLARR